MKLMLRFFYFKFIFCLFLFIPLISQSSVFRHLSVEDGLSSRRVYKIVKDNGGFMWFLTYTGIDRYDGSEFRHYTLSNDSVENSRIHLSKMTTDNKGDIWVSTKNGKIYCYNNINDEFVLKLNLANYLSDSISINVNLLKFDGEKIWFCLNSGFYVYSFETNALTLISNFSNTDVFSISENESTLYVCTQNGIYILNKPDLRVIEMVSLPEKVQVETSLFYRNKLYIGTFERGLYIYDIKTRKISLLNHVIPYLPVRVIVPHTNQVLVGTDGSGVYSIGAATNHISKEYQKDDDNSASLSGNNIRDIYVDEFNCVWVATSTNGVSILDPRIPEVKITQHHHNNENSLISSHVNAILEDSDGDMWYGTNNGVSLFLSKENKWHHFFNNYKINIGKKPVVIALCEDINKNIWVGGYFNEVFCIDKNTLQIKDSTTTKLSANYIYSICKDKDYIWLGGIGSSLIQYNVNTKKTKTYKINCIADIKNDEENIFIATCSGLCILDRVDYDTTWFREFNGKQPSAVKSVLSATDGKLWMATSMGLISLDTDRKRSTKYPSVFSTSVQAILEDKHNRMWFSSEKGLFCFNPKTKEIINIDEYIGNKDEHYNPNACLKRKNGNFVFGTPNGAVEFYPNDINEVKDTFSLIFTDFKLFYKSAKVEPESPLKKPINQTEKIELKYNQNSFSFSFSSIGYIGPNLAKYMCTLEGFDNGWHFPENSIGYTNISPGKYTFRLKAVNKYTGKVIDEKSINIFISKPFWLTTWAYIFYFLIVVAIIYMVFKYLKFYNDEKNSKDRIGFFISLAHDIRTPVTLVKAPLSELGETERLSETGKDNLTLALKNTDRLLALINQLLDFQKTSNLLNAHLLISENDLITYIKDKIASFTPPANQKNITITLHSTVEHLKVYFDTDKMDKIINNLLSNAVKYNKENGNIDIFINSNSQRWSLEVKDTGIGIPVKEQKNLFKKFYRANNAINSKQSGTGIGLLLAKNLVQLHQGNIEFSSVENQGSSFKITIPVGEKPGNENETFECIETENNTLLPSIMVVEDNDELRAYLQTTLSAEYNVFSFNNGKEALGKVCKINPDLVILDVLMPEMRGDEVSRILKTSVDTSHIPVILLTALNDRDNILQGLESGADDYITKPFDTSLLKARIKNILQNRAKLRKALTSETGLENEAYINTLDKEFIDKAIGFINKELDNPDYTINDFCRDLCMSRSSVYNKIKNLTGEGPNDFIKIIKLNKAKELLKQKQYNISEVAVLVGFSDAKYFSTSFKKQFGITPSGFIESLTK